MPEPDDFERFLEDQSIDPAQLFTDVPPPLPPSVEKAPSGHTPMGQITLEGQAYRSLSGGKMPWWVIISAWIIFGLPCLAITIIAATSGDLTLLVMLAFPAIILMVLWRGTQAKIASQREQAERKARRKRDMREK
jgi:hypothetical protein